MCASPIEPKPISTACTSPHTPDPIRISSGYPGTAHQCHNKKYLTSSKNSHMKSVSNFFALTTWVFLVFPGVPVNLVQPPLSHFMMQLFGSPGHLGPVPNPLFQHHTSPLALRPAARLSAGASILHWRSNYIAWPATSGAFCTFVMFNNFCSFVSLAATSQKYIKRYIRKAAEGRSKWIQFLFFLAQCLSSSTLFFIFMYLHVQCWSFAFSLWTKLAICLFYLLLSCLFGVRFRFFLLSRTKRFYKKRGWYTENCLIVSVLDLISFLGITKLNTFWSPCVWAQIFWLEPLFWDLFSQTISHSWSAKARRCQSLFSVTSLIRFHTHVDMLPMCCSSFRD